MRYRTFTLPLASAQPHGQSVVEGRIGSLHRSNPPDRTELLWGGAIVLVALVAGFALFRAQRSRRRRA